MPPALTGVELAIQVWQPPLVLQVEQVKWQPAQLPPGVPEKPVAQTHEPACRISLALQLRQLLLKGPLHVRQIGLQFWQIPFDD